MKIRKAVQHYIMFFLLVVSSLVEAASGFVLWFALPHGGGRFASKEFWSISRDTWTTMHDWAAVALIVIVLVHIIMHWKWVVTVTRQMLRSMKQEFSFNGNTGTPSKIGISSRK